MLDDYKSFTEKVYAKFSIDLQQYKEGQMKRRLTSLRDKRGFINFSTYFQAICNDKTLLDEFIDRITINVSEFYRNPKRWETLTHSIIPTLIKDKTHLTIWSAACSSGEEPYSIAMLMKEHFPKISVSIIATDLDQNVLDKAKKGVYHEQSLRELPLRLKNKYFKQDGSQFEIQPAVKQQVTFKRHNLLEDPYPTNIDLIICRNVLIYFTDVAKDLIYRNFSTNLSLNGVLFVGSTEQIFSPNQYGLRLLDTFFYQKITDL